MNEFRSEHQQQDPGGLDRRGVMRGATQVGLAALTAGAILGAAEPAQATPSRGVVPEAGQTAGSVGPHEPLVVHVRDAATGEMDLFHGDQHRQVYDRELATALLRHTR
ncbi:hypothetical protein [Streptomyces sp. SID1034]|uniref:hypothetical protein n=1 Tax=Streptomyces sp. SID1034 TaxID=2690248 RepID=UPI00136A3B02|nr:hypothetical protein [Streptomyces sp. SID1034]MYV89204.1 hypothetical protein [Streptomyces sp. SID1034]